MSLGKHLPERNFPRWIHSVKHISSAVVPAVFDLSVISTTNTSLERLFSASAVTITNKRIALNAVKIDNLMFLKSYLTALKIFHRIHGGLKKRVNEGTGKCSRTCIQWQNLLLFSIAIQRPLKTLAYNLFASSETIFIKFNATTFLASETVEITRYFSVSSALHHDLSHLVSNTYFSFQSKLANFHFCFLGEGWG